MANVGTKLWLGNQEALSGDYHILQPTFAIQGSMIGRTDAAGPQGDGVNEEVCFTQNTIDRHAVAVAIQDVRDVQKAQNGRGWNDEGAAYTIDTHATQGVAISTQVRRLTPVECARLQGFPDEYLDIEFEGKLAPDGAKYKALGNSWAVPVVRWIGERIDAVA